MTRHRHTIGAPTATLDILTLPPTKSHIARARWLGQHGRERPSKQLFHFPRQTRVPHARSTSIDDCLPARGPPRGASCRQPCARRRVGALGTRGRRRRARYRLSGRAGAFLRNGTPCGTEIPAEGKALWLAGGGPGSGARAGEGGAGWAPRVVRILVRGVRCEMCDPGWRMLGCGPWDGGMRQDGGACDYYVRIVDTDWSEGGEISRFLRQSIGCTLYGRAWWGLVTG